MSELDVIVIHIRAAQAEEYERLFAERELPRWWKSYHQPSAGVMTSGEPRPLAGLPWRAWLRALSLRGSATGGV